MNTLKGKVFVGMSGGVDSSVAAMLLKNQGYDVTGVYMKCFVQPDMSCMKEAMDAMGVAKMLDIPFEIWDFQKEYKKRVIDYMVEGYRQGLTPNPDIECNREIKFGLFLERALKLGADYVATGHYVRTRIMNNELGIREESTSLFEAKDKNKDQSYFLWTLGQKQLGHALFPVGDYLKSEVREIARKAGLPTAEKKDSQGICFVGKVTLDDFLKEYLPEKRGEVFSVSGEKLGEHNGAHFYTIGQRQGIGNIKHQKGVRAHKPLYVVSKDVQTNTVVVAEEGDENLTRNEVRLTGMNFINREYSNILKNVGVLKVWARVRYRQQLCEAQLFRPQITNNKSQTLKLVFEEPQKFVAEGQSAVFYVPSEASAKDGSNYQMIGGGIIA